MTANCKTTSDDLLAYEVFNEMEAYKITGIPVVDAQQHVIGIIHLHDILQAGVI
jgi:arabinose-5-phosphate isomerase